MKKNGSTLIELMIVVTIIGILAAVAIPKFAYLINKSKCEDPSTDPERRAIACAQVAKWESGAGTMDSLEKQKFDKARLDKLRMEKQRSTLDASVEPVADWSIKPAMDESVFSRGQYVRFKGQEAKCMYGGRSRFGGSELGVMCPDVTSEDGWKEMWVQDIIVEAY